MTKDQKKSLSKLSAIEWVKEFLETSMAQSLSLDDEEDRKLFLKRFKKFLTNEL